MLSEGQAPAAELSAADVRRRCDPVSFDFISTAELTVPATPLGQRRAMDALALGLTMRKQGCHVYVAGATGTGRMANVRAALARAASTRATPDDWCYVHNFSDPACPRALRLAAGEGRKLRDNLRTLVREARRTIPRAFESDAYMAARQRISETFTSRRDQGLQELAARAQRAGFALQAVPTGFVLVPVVGNRPMSDDEIAGLRPEMRETLDRSRAELGAEIDAFLRTMAGAERETVEQIQAQDRDVALHAVAEVMGSLTSGYAAQPAITAYLNQVREAILADVPLFSGHPLPTDVSLPEPAFDGNPEHILHERAFRKYEVNLVVDNAEAAGAPVVFETNPTYPNLIGRIEREALFGALSTDVTLISAGALHRANGGYLILRVSDLLQAPLSWEALKRALRERLIVIEDASEALGLVSTRGLRPEPIPLDVQVFLVGEPLHHQLLYTLDPDFRRLFKVRADFDTVTDRDRESETAYAQLLGVFANQAGLPLERDAVAELIEEASRLADDQQKLSIRLDRIQNLIEEAAAWARNEEAASVTAAHVRRAVEQRRYRSGLVQERLREMVARGVLLVQPQGTAAGQLYGLSVIDTGEVGFGHPSRITATIAAGREGVVDIERQVELGGPIHSKGVLILSGYLADQYAQDKPLALSARLVFEQTYEGVEGDSASLAELLALLSRLGDIPLKQTLAVTGSVNQRGEVQAVGGVNEKIEGFFDVCLALGLTGEQGVMLPRSNVSNLMLRHDVVAAVEQGRFHVYGIGTVDEALELTTGLPAAEVHARIDAKLRALADAWRSFSGTDGPGVERWGTNGAKPARRRANRIRRAKTRKER